jgi:hypothetical protein
MKTLREMMDLIESAQTDSNDKVRALNDAEYHHMSLLAKEAGITLGGLGADKITGDLYWSGTTKDGRNVNGVVKRTVSDADLDREEERLQAGTASRGIKEETQEYMVRVVDEENSGYTVKVQAASEQQALHKAIVKVRNQYDAYPEHARIIRQDVEEEPLEETEVDPVRRIEELFQDKR